MSEAFLSLKRKIHSRECRYYWRYAQIGSFPRYTYIYEIWNLAEEKLLFKGIKVDVLGKIW